MRPHPLNYAGRIVAIRPSAALVAILTLVAALLTCGRDTRAERLADQAHSLRLVPADAAVYTASLRIKEQWDNFANSKTYGRLMQIPVIQTAKMLIGFQWEQSPEPSIAAVREYLASPGGKEALAVVQEMMSDEVFCYGSADLAELIELSIQLNSVNRAAQLGVTIGGNDDPVAVTRGIREFMSAHKDQLNMADGVVGFRIRDRQRAIHQLDAVEAVFKKLLAENAPELAARLKREQIAGHDFLTLRVDGSLLPWEKLQTEATDVDPSEFEKWKALVIDKTLAVALGVIDDFVIVSFGDSTEHLEKLGRGPLLADIPAFARPSKHADQRVASISYAASAFMKKANSPRRSLTDAENTISASLQAAQINQDLRDRLVADFHAFADALAKLLPEPGDTAAISFLTPRGYESFRYNSGTLPDLDSSQPLTALDHVGGDPLCFVAAHGGDLSKAFEDIVKWLKPLALDAEKIVESQSSTADWAVYRKYREPLLELLRRIEFASREQVIPSLAAHEQAVVIDVASKSVQWFSPMSKSPQPLPMLEIGFVCRVSNAALLRQGISEYAAVAQDTLRLLHEIKPDEFPPLDLPAPQERIFADGALYVYPFPAEWGVDSQLAPNAGLTDQVAVVSVLPAFTEQLLKPTPPAIDTSLDLKRPAAVVTHFQFAKLVRAFQPWIDYGFGVATGQIRTDEVDEAVKDNDAAIMLQAGLVLPQVHQFLDVLAAFESCTTVTYREDDVWVTHAELRFKDLE